MFKGVLKGTQFIYNQNKNEKNNELKTKILYQYLENEKILKIIHIQLTYSISNLLKTYCLPSKHKCLFYCYLVCLKIYQPQFFTL